MLITMTSSLKLPGKKDHIVTAPSDYIVLGYYSLQYEHNNITCRPSQKLPPTVKEYIYFQIDG